MSSQYIRGRSRSFRIDDDTSVTPEHAASPFFATNTLRLTLRDGTRMSVPAFLDATAAPAVVSGQARSVNEDASVGSTLAALSATGSPTSWSIVGGNVNNAWAISNAGILAIESPLSYTTTAVYTLYVTVSNSAGVSAPTPVTVNVNQRVIPAPVVTGTALSVTENAPIDTIVGAVSATNNPITFTIVGGSSTFTITSAGVIKTTAAIDYETTTNYSLSIVAMNSGGSSAPVTVTISVVDVDESGGAPATFSGTPMVTETLTVNPGAYPIDTLYIMRNGRRVQPAKYPLPLTNVDAHKQISIAQFINGVKVYETTPIAIGQPTGTQHLVSEDYGPTVQAVGEIVGRTPATRGTLVYRGAGGFARKAGGGNFVPSTADTAPGRAGLQLGSDQMIIDLTVKDPHLSYYLELGFCMDGTDFLGGGYSYSNRGYALRLDKNWNLTGNFNVTLVRYNGPGDSNGVVLWTGQTVANTVRQLRFRVRVTSTAINVTLSRDNGADLTFAVNDTTHRGAFMLFSISRGGSGSPEWVMNAGEYVHTFIPEADQYTETYNDEFDVSGLSRFSEATASIGTAGTYRPRCPWDPWQIINYQASRDTFPGDTGKIGSSTPLNYQPLSITSDGLDIRQWRASPAEAAQFDWSDDATYRAVMDRDVEKWLSGTISTEYSFNQQYGRIEWIGRMSPGTGRGAWAEIWLYPLHRVWVSEIDFPELLGDKLGIASMGIHQRDVTATTETVTSQPVGLVPFPSGGSATDFHRYSIEWLPDRIEFEIDGKVVGVIRNHTIHERMFPIIRYPNGSVDLSGNWVLPPNNTSTSPSYLTTRAFRAYQRPSQRAAVPVFTSKPSLSITSGGFCTWLYGSSNGTPTKRWLAKSTTRIAGTENLTSYQLTDADRKRGNAPNDYGVEISVLEEHALPGGGIQRVRSEVYWVTQLAISMTSGQAPADFHPPGYTPPTGPGSNPPPTPPVNGLATTFDYYPARDGLALISGGPALESYEASYASDTTKKWIPRFTDGSTSDRAEGTINFQQEAFMVDPQHSSAAGWTPFVLDANNDLRIRARRITSTGINAANLPVDPSTGAPYQWVTGMLSTQASFRQYGGYFEADMKGDTNAGNWWSFWTLTGKVFSLRGEIDIVEVLGNQLGANGYQTNVIVSDNPANTHEAHRTVTGGSIASTFHRYGAYVTDTQIQFYLDGNPIGSPVDISNMPKLIDNPHTLILTNFVGSHIDGWIGHPTSDTTDPSTITIRRVTAWQRPGPVAIHISGTAYPDTLAVGGTVATLSTTAFGDSTGATYTLIDNPGGVFSIVGNQLRLAQTNTQTRTIRVRVADSAARTFTRLFTITVSQWVPSGVTNMLPSSTSIASANELPGVTVAGNVVTETATTGFHGTNWLSLTRAAGAKSYVALIEITSANVPAFNVQLVAGSTWGSGASAIFNLTSASVLFTNGYGGWTHTSSSITLVGPNRFQLRLEFVTDAVTTGVHALFRLANPSGNLEYAGATNRNVTVHELWLYDKDAPTGG